MPSAHPIPVRHAISRWRLRSQQLSEPHAASAADVLTTMLAVQAENPSQSAWAVATRTTDPDPTDLAGLLASGAVLRTHLLRPTWHYVAREDADWLIALTAPRVQRQTIEPQLRRDHGLSGTEVARLAATAVAVLTETPDLLRDELADELRRRRPALAERLTGQAVMILLAHLELDRLLCSGSPRDGRHTYASFAARVGHPTPPEEFDIDAALGRLAVRYFTGHGPATAADLGYWATLTLTDARRAVHIAGDRLVSFTVEDTTYWHVPGTAADGPDPSPSGHLLQVLDELYRGYQDSRMMIDEAGLVARGRERAIGMAVVDGQMVGWMKRDLSPARVRFQVSPLRNLRRNERLSLEDAADRYGAFLDRPAELIIG